MYNEIIKLKVMLLEADIPFVFNDLFDGFHICYPEEGTKRVCSVIEHYGSYGHSEDKLEIMGLLTSEELDDDEVLGNLSAEEVFSRIKKHWEEHHEEY